jgi:hypothetical protein
MGDGYDLDIKVNGILISSLKANYGEFSIRGVQLFHKNHYNKRDIGNEYPYLFCLNEGLNEIEVVFNLSKPKVIVKSDEIPSPPHSLFISIGSPQGPATKSILEFREHDQRSGQFRAQFRCYESIPEGYEAVIPTADFSPNRSDLEQSVSPPTSL